MMAPIAAAAPSDVLSTTLPVKPSVTTTSTSPREDVAPLDVADELEVLVTLGADKQLVAPRASARSP